ncbi:MAG TPA: Wadjet anti-phage system protein JetD domain-containing protein [Verrucomicrobiae bacterium]
MHLKTSILATLAGEFLRRKAGRTGAAEKCPTFDLEDLLRAAGCEEGDARALAEADLAQVERVGILKRVPFHKRDPKRIEKIRVPVEQEAALFLAAGMIPPTRQRADMAAQFAAAARAEVPAKWKAGWMNWCERCRQAALAGETIPRFDRNDPPANQQLLELLPKLLCWEGESLVRFASCLLCQNSKVLESLAARDREGEFRGKLRGRLGAWLEEITDGQIRSLDDLGILPNPRFALVHGPLRLQLDGAWLDFGRLRGAFRLAQTDIERADAIETTARRCLTVENEASFHELAKLQSGELLIHTSFPGSGTVKLLQRLPGVLEYWHFGDSDEAGFEILRVLCEKSGRNFQSLHMERGKIPFEQESLGKPRLPWPFYRE